MTIFIQSSDNPTQRKLLIQTAARVTDLASGSILSLEAILGPEFWDEAEESHVALGRYFSDLVSKGRVPFVQAGLTSRRHNRYRFTGWVTATPGGQHNSTSPSSDVLQ